MFVEYLTRGVAAGVVAGLVFGLFVAVVATPLIGYADELGHSDVEGDHADGTHGGADHADHGEPAGSMLVDGTVSVVSSGLWAVLLGGVFFGIVYYLLEPAIPGTGATKQFVLAAAGFLTVSGAPWLALPPVVPGAEQSLPVEVRLLLYGGLMAAGALACLGAGTVYNRLRDSAGRSTAAVAALGPLGLLVALAIAAPTNIVDSSLPAALQSGLTGLVVFGQLLLWAVLAVVHAWLQSRSDRDELAASTTDGDSATASTTNPSSTSTTDEPMSTPATNPRTGAN